MFYDREANRSSTTTNNVHNQHVESVLLPHHLAPSHYNHYTEGVYEVAQFVEREEQETGNSRANYRRHSFDLQTDNFQHLRIHF